MRIPERVRSALVPAAWFTALALVVAGPLLGGGYLLLLDWPSGPEFPKFSWFPLPSSGDIGNSTPLLALERLFRWVHVYLPDKVILLAPIVLGGWGVYRFARRTLGTGAAGALFGSTLFVVNPFVLDRYLAGHLHFLLAYSLLPWALPALVRAVEDPAPRRAVAPALWLLVFGIVDLHVAGMYGLLVLVVSAFAAGRWWHRLRLAASALGLGVLLSAFWIVPSLFVQPGQGIGLGDLKVYATRPGGFGVLARLLAMEGFWRDEFVGPTQRIPALYLLLVPILALVALGTVRLFRAGPRRPVAMATAVTAVMALLLAAGSSFPPTAGAFRWLLEHVALMGVYREPQKFLALVVLAYAVFGVAGLHELIARGARWHSAVPVGSGALALSVVLAYGYTMLGGFWGQVHLSHYPREWYEAARIMEENGPGRVLVLPWHLYAVWSFSDGRIVANPADSFFPQETLASLDEGFERTTSGPPDPFAAHVTRLLGYRNEIRWAGHLMAPLGVRYVVSATEVDSWRDRRLIARQRDLELLYGGDALLLLRNVAWDPPPLTLETEPGPRALSDVIGSDRERLVRFQLLDEAPAFPPPNDGLSPIARWFRSHTIRIGASSGVALSTRCTDGWRLDGREPRCHLGAVTTFTQAPGPSRLWRVTDGARFAGLLLSVLTMFALGFYVGRAYLWRSSDSLAPPATEYQ